MMTAFAPPLSRGEETEALDLLTARFPDVPIWFGKATRHWWALEGDRLIETVTPEELEHVLARWHPWPVHTPARPYIVTFAEAPRPDQGLFTDPWAGDDRDMLRRPVGSWTPAA